MTNSEFLAHIAFVGTGDFFASARYYLLKRG
jgi:hypothetical protein